jgi:NADPH-dependent curcumin reductase CurA
MLNREVHLIARPVGEPKPTDFVLRETPVPDPQPGQFVVQNTFMSVDPYMRPRMNDAKSYIPSFALNEPMDGGAVGTVIASKVDEVPVGATVLHGSGWREFAVLSRGQGRILDTAAAPEQAYLGVLGMPGLTAYAGLVDIAALKPGDSVFVSGAAGAVGSLAGQFAKLLGADRVIGSAGGAVKAARLVSDFGFDVAIDYRAGDLRGQLDLAAPDGVDVYFDNVGGDHLEAAISVLRPFGRVAMCGAISQYNATEPAPGPRNLAAVIGKRLTLRGFIVGDHNALAPQFTAQVSEWLRSGQLQIEETVVDGIENAVDAFLGLLRGANTGKMLVRF